MQSQEGCKEGTRGDSQAYIHLEGVIDAPLESGQGTNHDDTQREATGEESRPAATNLTSGCTSGNSKKVQRGWESTAVGMPGGHPWPQTLL